MAVANRRGFLGLLGGAAVAGPEVARQAGRNMATKASRSVSYESGLAMLQPETDSPFAQLKWMPRKDAFAKFGVPEFMESYWREQAKNEVRQHLGQDLVGMKSVSEAGKYMILLERYYGLAKSNDLNEKPVFWNKLAEWGERLGIGID